MKVVENPRKGGFAFVVAGGVWHRARPRMPEERPEVRLAVVVAGEPEGEWGPGYPDAGWDWPYLDQRGVERAQVGRVIALALEEHDPCCVDGKDAESRDDEGGVHPAGQNATWEHE